MDCAKVPTRWRKNHFLALSALRRQGSWLNSRRPVGNSPSSGTRTGSPCLIGNRTAQLKQTSCCWSRVSVASRSGSSGQRSCARKASSTFTILRKWEFANDAVYDPSDIGAPRGAPKPIPVPPEVLAAAIHDFNEAEIVGDLSEKHRSRCAVI